MAAIIPLQPRPYENLSSSGKRIDSIDLLRGLVMIIMALDHTRDFFHMTAWTADPLDPATTSPALYFTRWVTHLCAPTFVFLSGTSAWFQSLRKSKKELSLFLIKRGFWLILMEVTIVNLSFGFDLGFHLIALQVIWAIGISMVILGLLIWLPYAALLVIGIIIVAGHNILDFAEAKNAAPSGVWYNLLHQPKIVQLWSNHSLLVFYPFLAWTGLMILGYCFGKLFLSVEGSRRNKMLIALGLGLLVFFALLRYTNYYGNPFPWSEQRTGFRSFLSFMNVQKYPPSLLFMCATIGISLLLLALLSKVQNRVTDFITVYGRVPFFYYVIHFYLIHFVSAIFFFTRGHSFAEGTKPSGTLLPFFIAPGEGVRLPWVYLIWILVVLSLYPLCKWYSRYKKTHDYWWLSYL